MSKNWISYLTHEIKTKDPKELLKDLLELQSNPEYATVGHGDNG